jgi:RHS repeat-associated protein
MRMTRWGASLVPSRAARPRRLRGTRLYDGFTVVADGNTQLSTAPNGQVLSETTTTTTVTGWGWCKKTTTSVASVDVLTDVLGSAVGTASKGVVSSDLALYGDFGEALTTPKQDTVTGFTGKVETAGLVEFASRTYDPSTRQWVQDDRYRGTTTRAASMNRYAYVEGAPETFVDALGFFRAAAALQAQKLATLNAQLQSALASLGGLYGDALKWGQNLSVAQMLKIYGQLNSGLDPAVKAALDPIVRQLAMQVADIHAAQKLETMIQQHNREVAQSIIEEYQHAQWVAQEKARVAAREQARIDAYNKSLDKGYLGGFVDTLSIAGHGLVNVGSGAVNFLGDAWDRGSTLVQYEGQVIWRILRDPLQAVQDAKSGTLVAENAVGLFQIVVGDAELYNEGNYCGNAGECFQGGFTPVDGDGNPQAITIGHTVTFPAGEQITSGWVEHEFTHVLQYEILGGNGFALIYGAEQIWGTLVEHKSWGDAYQDQSLEEWARAVQRSSTCEPGQNPQGQWCEVPSN